MIKEAYYFSHDSNARNDEKILCLRADFGAEGYGAFWILIEMMFENQNTSLSHKHIKGIAHSLNMNLEVLSRIIDACIDYGLFKSDGEFFWSESLRKRKGEYLNKREKKVEAGLRSGEVRRQKSIEKEQNLTSGEQLTNTFGTEPEHDAKDVQTLVEQSSNNVQSYSEQNANTGQTDAEQLLNITPTEMNKLKEKKEKEIKEKEILSSSPPKSEISEEGKEFANFFKGLLPPTQKITDSDLKNWGDTFDKLVRIDKRSREEIYQVTEWARKDSFWGEQGNFLSACKLRSKSKDGVLYYDIFLQKFKQNRNKFNGAANEKQFELPSWIKGEG